MRKLLVSFGLLITLLSGGAKAADVGVNLGLGLPFVSQMGLNVALNKNLDIYVGYNNLSIDVGEAGVDLTMPEVSAHYFPWAGSFFVGLGVGRETLEVTAVDSGTSLSVGVDVSATTLIAKLGWMWGRGDGGFWFGMDLSLISPMGGDVDIDAPGVPTSSDEYQDVKDAGEQFGETAYYNITFARFGYLF